MNVKCPQCTHEYSIPGRDVQGKKTYFYCDHCGHRVIIDRRARSISLKGSVGELWEAIPFSWSARLLFVSVLFIVISFILTIMSLLIFRENMTFLASHPMVAGGLATLLLAIFYLLFLTASFYIAAFTCNSIRFPEDHSLSVITPHFRESFPGLLLLAAFPLIVYALLLPVAFLKTYGLIYAGIVFPILAPFLVIFILFSASPQLTCAFMAYETRSMRNTISNYFSFLLRENFTIFLYIFFSRIISLLTLIVVLILTITLASFFLGAVAILSDASIHSVIPQFFGSLLAQVTDPQAAATGFPPQVKLGLSILFAMGAVIFIVITSVYVIVYQVACTLSLYIMETNPKKSLNVQAMIIAGMLGVLFIAGWAFLKFFL
jgi:DNA-directed RNA polymerase subunit RPC12/RpoP